MRNPYAVIFIVTLLALFVFLAIDTPDVKITGAVVGVDTNLDVQAQAEVANTSPYVWHIMNDTTFGMTNATGIEPNQWNFTPLTAPSFTDVAIDPNTNNSYWSLNNDTIYVLTEAGALSSTLRIPSGLSLTKFVLNYSDLSYYTASTVGGNMNFSKYNSSGVAQWSVEKASHSPNAITLTANGSVALLSTDTGVFPNLHYLFMFDGDGVQQWNKSITSASISVASLDRDSNGSIYVLLPNSSHSRLEKYHLNGELAWREVLGSLIQDEVSVDNNDTIFVSGDNGGFPSTANLYKFNTAGKILLNLTAHVGTLDGLDCDTACYALGTNTTDGLTNQLMIAKYYSNNFSQIWNLSMGGLTSSSIIAVRPVYSPKVSPPNVTLLIPTNGTNLSSGLQAINVSVKSVEDTVDTVLFEVDNGTTPFNLTTTNASGNWNANLNVSTVVEGVATITVFANDSVNRINNSNTIKINVDRTPPTVRLANSTHGTTDTTPSITFNYTDFTISANCTLYLNGDHNASNAAVVNNTDTILTASTLNDALYVTTVNCTDGSSNKGNSSAITITVDATVPNVTASDALPSSTSFTNSSNVVEISINATDTLFLDDVLANITHPNGSIFLVALSNRTNYPNKFNVSFTVPRTANGNFNITFVVNDSNNNRNATIKTGFIINMTDTDGDGVPDPVDKLTGNITNVTTTGVSSLNVSIGGRPLNETLTGKKEVGFYDGSTVLVNFSHNFSISSLDLSKMTVISTATTLIINFSNEVNVTYNKTLFITDDSFATLCVKDQEISAAADISDACTGSNETSFTNCLGGTQTSGAITCTDFGTTIRFENLRYSGVKATQTASSSSVAEGSGGGGGGSAGAGGGRCAKGYSLVDGNCIHDETGEVQKARPEQVVEEEAQEEVVQEEQAEPGQEEQEVGAENLAGQASRFSFREFVNDYSKFWIVGVIVLVILIAGIFIYRWTKHWHSE